MLNIVRGLGFHEENLWVSCLQGRSRGSTLLQKAKALLILSLMGHRLCESQSLQLSRAILEIFRQLRLLWRAVSCNVGMYLVSIDCEVWLIWRV